MKKRLIYLFSLLLVLVIPALGGCKKKALEEQLDIQHAKQASSTAKENLLEAKGWGMQRKDDGKKDLESQLSEICQLYKTLKGPKRLVRSIVFSPDRKILASAPQDGPIRLWSLETGETLRVIKGNSFPIYNIAFSPDGKTLASASFDTTIRLWSADTWDTFKVFKEDIGVKTIAFSSDGTILASGASRDGTIRIWKCALNGK